MNAHIERTVSADRRGCRDSLLADAAALVGMGAWSCDLASERLEWTDAVFDLFGLSNERHPDRRAVIELYREPHREVLERLRSQAIQSRSGFAMDAQIRRPDNELRWIRITARTAVENGRSVRLFGMKQDITAEKAEWDRLRRLAENDTLTGLANRARFHAEFLDLTRDDDALRHVGALVLFDLNAFKAVNDRWGHATGDLCLARFAERLADAFPQARLVARIGGDEFAIVLPATMSPCASEALVRKHTAKLAAPIRHLGRSLPLGFSAGMAFNLSPPGTAPDELFAAADTALYRAKRAGRPALCVSRHPGIPELRRA